MCVRTSSYGNTHTHTHIVIRTRTHTHRETGVAHTGSAYKLFPWRAPPPAVTLLPYNDTTELIVRNVPNALYTPQTHIQTQTHTHGHADMAYTSTHTLSKAEGSVAHVTP